MLILECWEVVCCINLKTMLSYGGSNAWLEAQDVFFWCVVCTVYECLLTNRRIFKSL